MAIRSILAGLSGGSASNGVIELACRLAQQFEAYLEGFHVSIDKSELVIAAGAEGLAASTTMQYADELASTAAEKAKMLRQSFGDAVARHNLPPVDPPGSGRPGHAWRQLAGDAPALLASRARFFDLAVLGRSERVIDQPHTDAIEETLICCGRPILLAPSHPPATFGQTVALCWNGSPEAIHALVAALPFLQRAQEIVLLALGEVEAGELGDLRTYLQLHDIAAKTRTPEGGTAGVGEGLLSTARDEGADLVVLGGYGHSPLHETLLGGTTRQALGTGGVPLLIAH